VTTLTVWAAWLDDHRFLATLGALALVVAATAAVLAARLVARRVGRAARWAAGKIQAGGFVNSTTLLYLAALGALGNNAATSWAFVRDVVHMHSLPERVVLFSVVEFALLSLTAVMRSVVRRSQPGEPRRPGPAGTVAWALCGVTALAAWEVSGPVVGTVRVLTGAVLYEVLLHLALGIDRRERTGQQGTLARIAGELRERALSRLGLGDDARDAVTRTRERAAHRAARLAIVRRTPFRQARLQRALRISQVASDPERMDAMLAEITVLKHASKLGDLDWSVPWSGPRQTTGTGQTAQPDRTGQTSTGPDHAVPADQTTPAATVEQTSPAPDQTSDTPADQPAAVVRSLRTADGLTAPQANARILLNHYRDLIDGGRLPGNRQIREDFKWGPERVKGALRELPSLIDQEATA
jgi:hypothetical protein